MCAQLSLMDEAGNTKDDLSLPKGTDDAEKLAVQIQEDFEGGKELVVTVLKVGLCGTSVLMHVVRHILRDKAQVHSRPCCGCCLFCLPLLHRQAVHALQLSVDPVVCVCMLPVAACTELCADTGGQQSI